MEWFPPPTNTQVSDECLFIPTVCLAHATFSQLPLEHLHLSVLGEKGEGRGLNANRVLM